MMHEQRKLIEVTTSAGKVLQAFEGDEITRQIQRKGEYDLWALASLRDVLGWLKPRTSLDIGANIGNHAVVIGELSIRIIAFEPLPFVYAALRENLRRNVGSSAECFEAALSDTEGVVHMGVRDNGNFGASSLDNLAKDGLQIRTLVGDSFLEKHGVEHLDFIKIDVEGHEAAALAGLAGTVRRDQPLVMMEWNDAATQQGFAERNLFETVFSGYQAFGVTRTDSTKLYAPTPMARMRRIYHRVFDRRWCLTVFNPARKYSNVYLVPSHLGGEFAARWNIIPEVR